MAVVQSQLLWLGPELLPGQGEGWAPGLAHEHTCFHVRLWLRGLRGCLQHMALLMEPVLCAPGRDMSWHCAE